MSEGETVPTEPDRPAATPAGADRASTRIDKTLIRGAPAQSTGPQSSTAGAPQAQSGAAGVPSAQDVGPHSGGPHGSGPHGGGPHGGGPHGSAAAIGVSAQRVRSQGGTAVATPQPWAPPAGQPQPDRPAGAPVPTTAAPLHGPWPQVSVFGQRWPGPGRPPTPAAIGVLAAAAVIAALSIDGVGLGWLVSAVAGAAALVSARLLPERADTGPIRWPELVTHGAAGPVRYAWGAATVALLGVGTLRSAGWLFLLCLCTAVVTGALALTDGRSMRALSVATLMAMVAPFRALGWMIAGLAGLRRRTPGRGNGIRVTATIAVSVALLVVFGTLFASADATFARVLESLVPELEGGAIFRWVLIFVLAGGVLGGSAFLATAPPRLATLDGDSPRKVSRLEWAIPLALLTLLFAAFVAVQLTVLFGGSAHVLDTDGLTYAEYARGGFWQLLIVTGLTLLVLAGAARWAPRRSRADRLLIRAILGGLAVLTLVIVASALHRMTVYADTYGLTRLRLLVFLCELWLGAVFVLVLAAGLRLRAAWLPRAAVGAGVLMLLGMVIANPDGVIAERNVTRYEQTGRIDSGYLSNLSPDAVPALNRLGGTDPEMRDCTLFFIHDRVRFESSDWQTWSYGRERAREVLAADPPTYPTGCPSRLPAG